MAENFPKLVRHKTIDKRNSKNTEQDKYQKKNDYWVYYIWTSENQRQRENLESKPEKTHTVPIEEQE